LYDFRFSRRFVLVRVAYLSRSEAYTYNSDVFGTEDYLEEKHYFHKASNQPAMIVQPIRLTGASCVRIFFYYIIQQGEELTCLHFFTWKKNDLEYLFSFIKALWFCKMERYWRHLPTWKLVSLNSPKSHRIPLIKGKKLAASEGRDS
jgi:hypothetical protein